jgi:patatin-like phospholipase/acyl hydrolase
MASSRPIFVLSIDGGGILGIIPLKILEHIEKEAGKPIAELFDLITGVSTGGIIALGLTMPSRPYAAPSLGCRRAFYSAKNMSEIYKTRACDIFKKTSFGRFCDMTRVTSLLYALFFSQYQEKGAEALFKEVLGDTPFSHAVTRVLILAYNLQRSLHKGPRLKLFRSYPKPLKQPCYHHIGPKEITFLMKDVARATSSVPTFFPAKYMHYRSKTNVSCETGYFVDGAVVVNDPALFAFLEARRLFPDSEIFILSLGIGKSGNYDAVMKSASPGILKWKKDFFRLIVDPHAESHRSLLRKLIKNSKKSTSYCRIESKKLPNTLRFDDSSPKTIETLNAIGEALVQEEKETLRVFLELLKKKN